MSFLPGTFPGASTYFGGVDRYTKMMWHCNGVDGAQTTTCSCWDPLGCSAIAGTAKISTAKSKFGPSSLYFPGSVGSWARTNYSNWTHDIYNGMPANIDWTLDLWVWPNATASQQVLWSHTYTTPFYPGWFLDIGSGNVRFWACTNATYCIQQKAIAAQQWSHVAVVRSGGSIYMYVNGVSAGAGWAGQTGMPSSFVGMHLGTLPGDGYNFGGYLDEIRLSVGIARWTTNFVPPTQPYGYTAAPIIGGIDAFTKAMMHFEGNTHGTQDGAFLTDSELTPKTWTGTAYTECRFAKLGQTTTYFNGSSLFVESADCADWDLIGSGSDYTIDFWYAPQDWASHSVHAICSQGQDANNYWMVNFELTGTVLQLGTRIGSAFKAARLTISQPALNVWAHYAIERYNGQYHIYINGVRNTPVLDNGCVDLPNASAISYALDLGVLANVGYWAAGYFDEFRISKGTARYRGEDFTPNYRPYDAGTPVTLPDYGGNDSYTKLLLHMDGVNNGTSFSDASLFTKTVTPNGDAKTVTAAYKFGNSSAYFAGGSGDSLTIPNSTDVDFGTGNFTVDFWVRRDGAQTAWIGLVTAALGTGGWLIHIGASNDVQFSHSNVTNEIVGVTLADLTWTHVAVVRDGNNVKMYQNGVQVGSTYDATGVSINSNGHGLAIGQGDISGGSPFKGWIDEVRISKGVARWRTGFRPPTQPYDAVTPFGTNFAECSI